MPDPYWEEVAKQNEQAHAKGWKWAAEHRLWKRGYKKPRKRRSNGQARSR